MPKTIQDIINEAVDRALRHVLPALKSSRTSPAKQAGLRKTPKARTGTRGRSRVEITRWVADRNARRVPLFVIEATGLDTKKKIVAKFGENAAFVKGKPVPVAHRTNEAERVVKARPPLIRKGTAQ